MAGTTGRPGDGTPGEAPQAFSGTPTITIRGRGGHPGTWDGTTGDGIGGGTPIATITAILTRSSSSMATMATDPG